MTTTLYQQIDDLRKELNQRIIGQPALINSLLVALLANGHLLVEGAPGLAKTTAIKELAKRIQGNFQRIQFTPDLLPADLTGTEIYQPQQATFKFESGPLFHNLLLADEINRAPAKVQSALLEAMAEQQITVGRKTYALPELFLVMATQNPLEHEGTYPLPEAQLDRFLLYVKIGYPDIKHEQEILHLAQQEALGADKNVPVNTLSITQATIFAARKEVLNVHISTPLEDYLLRLIMGTRNPSPYGTKLTQWLRYGASPRATIGLARCARAYAWLSGRDYVIPDDIQIIAFDILRHRLILSYSAQAEGITSDDVICELIKQIAVP